MDMDFELKYAVDEDLLAAKDIWKKFSYDAEKLENLFNTLIFKYVDKIDGFSEDLEVISPYDDKIKHAEALRYNVEIIIKRLEIIKKQDYRTDGLREYYLKEGVEGRAVQINFNEARRAVSENDDISKVERNEILNKLDEIEEICISVEPKREKWNKLRPYVVWASGKDVTIALIVLSLIQRIN